MTPDLVRDKDVLVCLYYLGQDWIDSRSGYRMHFSFALERPLSLEETDEILSKAHGYGPHPVGATFGEMERSPETFWRSPL